MNHSGSDSVEREDSIEETELELEGSSDSQVDEGHQNLEEDGVVVAVVGSVELEVEAGDVGSSSSGQRGSDGSRCVLDDVLLEGLGGNGEEALLSDNQHLSFELTAISGSAENIDVDGEDVSNEEETGGAGVGCCDCISVDVVESGVDDHSCAGSSISFRKHKLSDTVDSIAGIREVVVMLVEGSGCSSCSFFESNSRVEGAH